MECAWIVRLVLLVSAVSDTYVHGVVVQVRLFGGHSDSEGGLAVRYGDYWGLVCDDSWDISDARVACRMLGFLDVESATSQSAFGDEPPDIVLRRDLYLLDDVNCIGNEDSLLNCSHSGLWNNNCRQTSKTAGVVCTNKTARLVSPPYRWVRQEGKVQVYASDAWRSVCNDTWNMNHGQILCREMSYPGVLRTFGLERSGSEEHASIGNLTCTVDAEPTLSECSVSVTKTGCRSGYAGVECQPAARFTTSTNVPGAVEVYHDGQWRIMCYGGDSTAEANAKLACRMMGLPRGQVLGSQSPLTGGGFLGISYTCTSPSASSIDEKDLRFCKNYRHDNCTMVLRIACEGFVAVDPHTGDYSYSDSWQSDATTTSLTARYPQDLTHSEDIGRSDSVTNTSIYILSSAGTSLLEESTTSTTCSSAVTTSTQATVATSCSRISYVLTSGNLVTFGETPIGSKANSSFTCVLNATTTEEYLISRQCTRTANGDASWLQPEYAPCKQLTNRQDAIHRLSTENITDENAGAVSEGLVKLTTNLTDLGVEELSNVTFVLFEVTHLAAAKSQVSQNVLEVVDNILDVATSEASADPESNTVKSSVLSTTNALISALQRGSNENINYSGYNILVAAVKVVRNNFPLTAEIQNRSPSEDGAITFTANESVNYNPENIDSVFLPDAILDFLPDNDTTLSVSIFVLRSSSLFREIPQNSSSHPEGPEREVISAILSVTIEGATIFNLSEPVVLRFLTDKQIKKSSNATPYCAFWDVKALGGMWSREGCETKHLSGNDQVTCICSHLTSFAVLLDRHGDVTSKAAHIISQIGVSISIVCLVLTLCILLGFRKVRQKQAHQIQANLSFALLCLYVVFAVGIERVEWGVGCIVVAVLLQFFCLSSIFWMGVEAFHMYLLFVRVLRIYVPRLLLKCSLVAWGLPLIISVASVSSKWKAYDNEKYCYMMPGPSLWYGLLLLVALILAFNFIVYVMVIYRLTCGRKMVSTSTTDSREGSAGELAEIIRRARNAIAIGTLVGVTWVFGFLTISSAREFIHLLFNIFNSFQGAFIFLLFGVRQPEVQEMWQSARMKWKSTGQRKSSGFETSLSSGLPRMTPRPSEVTELNSTLPRPSICSSSSANSNFGQKHLVVTRPL